MKAMKINKFVAAVAATVVAATLSVSVFASEDEFYQGRASYEDISTQEELENMGKDDSLSTFSFSLEDVNAGTKYNYVIEKGGSTTIKNLPVGRYSILFNLPCYYSESNVTFDVTNMNHCTLTDTDLIVEDSDATADLSFKVKIDSWRGFSDSKHISAFGSESITSALTTQPDNNDDGQSALTVEPIVPNENNDENALIGF